MVNELNSEFYLNEIQDNDIKTTKTTNHQKMTLLKLNDDSLKQPQLTGDTYLVTGAANGIGRALSFALARCGASVILLDKDDLKLNDAYDSIMKTDCSEPVIVHQDLTLLTQNHCDVLAKQIKKTFGSLDGIIHCAVETGNLSPIAHYAQDDWASVIKANLHSPYLLTRSLFPLITSNKPGTIIFSSTEQAQKSSAYWGAFAVAHQGLKGLVETWSQEIEYSNVQMFMLDPGKVNTEFLIRLYPGINPNQFPDSKTIAQKYVQLLMQSKLDKTLQGAFIQLREHEFELVD